MNEPKEGSVIFITGATGFLGGAVVAHLVESKTPCRLVLLARGESDDVCVDRIKRSVSRFVGPAQVNELLVSTKIIRGDVTDKEWQDDESLDDVTHALHLAAKTSFGLEPGMRQTNIHGAIAVASTMKRKRRLKRYIHVGTGMICGANPPRVIREDNYPRKGNRYLVPYTATKAETETLLTRFDSEFPLVVARPSIVVGHTNLGCAPSGSIFWTLRAIHALKQITWALNRKVDLIPVDYAAASLVHLLLKPALSHKRYHISAGTDFSPNWSEINEAFSKALGESSLDLYQKVKFSEITEERIRKRIGPGPTKKMLKALKLYYQFGALGVVFDNSRLLAEGMRSPPRFTSYLELCVKTSSRCSIYHQMRYDQAAFRI